MSLLVTAAVYGIDALQSTEHRRIRCLCNGLEQKLNVRLASTSLGRTAFRGS